jgi:hypothetical protein
VTAYSGGAAQVSEGSSNCRSPSSIQRLLRPARFLRRAPSAGPGPTARNSVCREPRARGPGRPDAGPAGRNALFWRREPEWRCDDASEGRGCITSTASP